jgi:hypothetical protein
MDIFLFNSLIRRVFFFTTENSFLSLLFYLSAAEVRQPDVLCPDRTEERRENPTDFLDTCYLLKTIGTNKIQRIFSVLLVSAIANINKHHLRGRKFEPRQLKKISVVKRKSSTAGSF